MRRLFHTISKSKENPRLFDESAKSEHSTKKQSSKHNIHTISTPSIGYENVVHKQRHYSPIAKPQTQGIYKRNIVQNDLLDTAKKHYPMPSPSQYENSFDYKKQQSTLGENQKEYSARYKKEQRMQMSYPVTNTARKDTLSEALIRSNVIAGVPQRTLHYREQASPMKNKSHHDIQHESDFTAFNNRIHFNPRDYAFGKPLSSNIHASDRLKSASTPNVRSSYVRERTDNTKYRQTSNTLHNQVESSYMNRSPKIYPAKENYNAQYSSVPNLSLSDTFLQSRNMTPEQRLLQGIHAVRQEMVQSAPVLLRYAQTEKNNVKRLEQSLPNKFYPTRPYDPMNPDGYDPELNAYMTSYIKLADCNRSLSSIFITSRHLANVERKIIHNNPPMSQEEIKMEMQALKDSGDRSVRRILNNINNVVASKNTPIGTETLEREFMQAMGAPRSKGSQREQIIAAGQQQMEAFDKTRSQLSAFYTLNTRNS